MKNRVVSILAFVMVCFVCASGVTSANPDQSQTVKPGLRVMSYNVLHGGTRRGQPLSQTAKVILAAGADIVGLQEIGGNARELADLLGWEYSSHGSAAIMTRFEIVEGHDGRTKPRLGSGGVRVRLDSGQEVYVFNVHLTPYPYQPYQLLGIGKDAIKTQEEAIAAANKTRGHQFEELLEKIGKLSNKDLPVFVTGDFNEPSHLDWTTAAAKSGRNPIKVAYPGSSAMTKKGFLDAWRVFHPDEMKHPGYTWTPVTKPDDPKDHHDRIDFVYFRGQGVEVKNASVVGENKKKADIVVSPYPSDHRAVVCTFALSTNSYFSDEKSNDQENFGLKVAVYVSSSPSTKFQGATHLAFGAKDLEIVSDCTGSQIMYRESPRKSFQISPLALKKHHSLVYNLADQLYYLNDTDHHRIIAFKSPASDKISAQTKKIAGVALDRPHDVVLDPETGWIYTINPNSGHVFRFKAIGKEESVLKVPVLGYSRALTFVNGKLYVINSAKGRVVEVVDWEKKEFKIYDSFDPTNRAGPAGSWKRTGLVLNDLDFFDGYFYATSYFTKSYAHGTDPDENKFIRFKKLEDLGTGDWTDLSDLVPKGMTPYYLTTKGKKLYLAIFNHESPGSGDSILRFSLPSDSIDK